MVRVLLVLCLLGVSVAKGYDLEKGWFNWHENVGVKQAEYIKRSEVNILGMQRIVGGAIAPINAHPYLVGLLIGIVGLPSPSACGGSILSNTRVLTAAHCWNDGRNQARTFEVVFGSAFLFHGGVRIFANGIAVHPEYDARRLANDVAILSLSRSVAFSNTIRPIKLPSGTFRNIDFTGVWAKASGYGRYSDLTLPNMNTVVRHIFLQTIPLNSCRAKYGTIVLDSNICTSGTGGVGICQGDSGGPLTINVQGEDILIGISSFVAYDGCELGFPSVFARVTSFLGWIERFL